MYDLLFALGIKALRNRRIELSEKEISLRKRIKKLKWENESFFLVL